MWAYGTTGISEMDGMTTRAATCVLVPYMVIIALPTMMCMAQILQCRSAPSLADLSWILTGSTIQAITANVNQAIAIIA